MQDLRIALASATAASPKSHAAPPPSSTSSSSAASSAAVPPSAASYVAVPSSVVHSSAVSSVAVPPSAASSAAVPSATVSSIIPTAAPATLRNPPPPELPSGREKPRLKDLLTLAYRFQSYLQPLPNPTALPSWTLDLLQFIDGTEWPTAGVRLLADYLKRESTYGRADFARIAQTAFSRAELMGPLPLDLPRVCAIFVTASLELQNAAHAAGLADQHSFDMAIDSLRLVYEGFKL